MEEGKGHLVCKLKKSIYGLKQMSRQWYLKFHRVIRRHGFFENPFDACIYLKINRINSIILVLYVDDILLAASRMSLLNCTKSFMQNHFEMNDLGEAAYVLGIEIKRDRK